MIAANGSFVSWLKGKGITLSATSSHGQWKVTNPKVSDAEYDVVFSIRSFPSWASNEQMRNAIQGINLAYVLNARAHPAMSYGTWTAADPASWAKSEDELPKVDGLPVTEAAQKYFRQYGRPSWWQVLQIGFAVIVWAVLARKKRRGGERAPDDGAQAVAESNG